MILHCRDCSHQWSVELTLPMDLDLFSQSAKRIADRGCPHCGANHDRAVCVGPAPKADASAVRV